MIKITISNPLTGKARPRFNRKTGHAYHDNRYRSWMLVMREKLKQLYPKPFKNFFCLYMRFYLKNGRVIDLDNLAGSVLDSIVDSGCIPDDSTKHLVRLYLDVSTATKERIEIYVMRDYQELRKTLDGYYYV